MRVVFMGTPEFAVPSLQQLISHGFEVAAVVTQPDRPAGRGGRSQPPAVKVAAQAAGLTILQPERLRDPSALALLRDIAPQAIVVVAYGKILRRAVLELPPLGCINLHPSLLPRFRGAAPIQAAIRCGDTTTGVTVMLMNERMDAGPILTQETASIFADDTAATLGQRLAQQGADLLVATLPQWEAGIIQPREQDESAASYCQPLRKQDASIDWSQSAEIIARACRAQTPWPGCQSDWQGKLIRLFDLRPQTGWSGSAAPGTTFLLTVSAGAKPALAVAAGQGAVVVSALQLPGKRPQSADDFLRGQPRFLGARLSSAPITES